MAYAQQTKVSVEKTKIEIEAVLKKNGADRFAYFTEPGRAGIVFAIESRQVKFVVSVDEKHEQRRRQRWRALFLCIKAKLESIKSGIETFDEAFLAHTVMPDGRTVYERTNPTLLKILKTGKMVELLPPPDPESSTRQRQE
jgi:hypothetical protein